MQDFGDILDNRVLLTALVACVIAQATKLVVELVV
ncbi:MAG: divergent PAP2 family protein, partial [Leptolyngbyaceae cyanobacterium SU_3_3]|nr:divergent PAP2 family protein [Leptolyngbyaceae cyanobacterium SU_3_3]